MQARQTRKARAQGNASAMQLARDSRWIRRTKYAPEAKYYFTKFPRPTPCSHPLDHRASLHCAKRWWDQKRPVPVTPKCGEKQKRPPRCSEAALAASSYYAYSLWYELSFIRSAKGTIKTDRLSSERERPPGFGGRPLGGLGGHNGGFVGDECGVLLPSRLTYSRRKGEL